MPEQIPADLQQRIKNAKNMGVPDEIISQRVKSKYGVEAFPQPTGQSGEVGGTIGATIGGTAGGIIGAKAGKPILGRVIGAGAGGIAEETYRQMASLSGFGNRNAGVSGSPEEVKQKSMENLNRILLAGGYSAGIEGLMGAGGKILGGLKGKLTGLLPQKIGKGLQEFVSRSTVPLPSSIAKEEIQRKTGAEISGKEFETTAQTFLRGLKEKFFTSNRADKLLIESVNRRGVLNKKLSEMMAGPVGNKQIDMNPLFSELDELVSSLEQNRAISKSTVNTVKTAVNKIKFGGDKITIRESLRDKETIDNIFSASVRNDEGAAGVAQVQKKYANFLRGASKDMSSEVSITLNELSNLHNIESSLTQRLSGPGIIEGSKGEEISPFAGVRGALYRMLSSPLITVPALQGKVVPTSPLIGGGMETALRGITQFGGRQPFSQLDQAQQ